MKKSKKIFSDSVGKHLIIRNEIVHQYRMFDSIPLFIELPRSYHIDYGETNFNTKKISMKDVVSFKILKNPESKWLEKIETARNIYFEDNGGEDSTTDIIEPLWVHEIVNNPKEFECLELYFKEWTNR